MGSTIMISENRALPGREQSMPVPDRHYVLGTALQGPWPGTEQLVFGMGCFWGAERLFWKQHGVICTMAGYAGGHTPNPDYYEVCSGKTGHTEVVRVVFNPLQIKAEQLLELFWREHDPTQGMRQGNDIGTQYRSAIYCPDESAMALAERSRQAFQLKLTEAGFGEITTEIRQDVAFYYAEPEHQQYLAKNPGGYCGLRGTGVVPD